MRPQKDGPLLRAILASPAATRSSAKGLSTFGKRSRSTRLRGCLRFSFAAFGRWNVPAQPGGRRRGNRQRPARCGAGNRSSEHQLRNPRTNSPFRCLVGLPLRDRRRKVAAGCIPGTLASIVIGQPVRSSSVERQHSDVEGTLDVASNQTHRWWLLLGATRGPTRPRRRDGNGRTGPRRLPTCEVPLVERLHSRARPRGLSVARSGRGSGSPGTPGGRALTECASFRCLAATRKRGRTPGSPRRVRWWPSESRRTPGPARTNPRGSS